jgi:diguanylate cyclase (GGDEF)-like protein
MLDIDFFKVVNDSHGHQVGDQVLKGVAEICKQNLRIHDFACRYGGEEFAVLSPGITAQEAGRLGEKLRALLEATSVKTFGFPLTISIGAAQYPTDPAKTEQSIEVRVHTWVSAADSALYRAKESGRNKVVIARGY